MLKLSYKWRRISTCDQTPSANIILTGVDSLGPSIGQADNLQGKMFLCAPLTQSYNVPCWKSMNTGKMPRGEVKKRLTHHKWGWVGLSVEENVGFFFCTKSSATLNSWDEIQLRTTHYITCMLKVHYTVKISFCNPVPHTMNRQQWKIKPKLCNKHNKNNIVTVGTELKQVQN